MSWLQTREVYSVTVTEARNERWRWCWGHAPAEVSREESVPLLLLVAPGVLWLTQHLSNVLFSSPSNYLLFSMSSFLPPVRALIDLRAHHNPTWSHLNPSLNHICRGTVSKRGHALKSWVDINIGWQGDNSSTYRSGISKLRDSYISELTSKTGRKFIFF